MDVKQLRVSRNAGRAPRAPLDVVIHPDGIQQKGDCDWRLVEALRRRDATAAECLVATFGERSSCAMSKDYRWPRSPTP